MGLTYFKRYRMEIDLRRDLFRPPELPAGYRLAPWTASLLQSHAQAKYQSFQHEIDANVFPCLGDREGCYRLMDEISRRDGFLAAATWLIQYDAIDPPTEQLRWERSRRSIKRFRRAGLQDLASAGQVQAVARSGELSLGGDGREDEKDGYVEIGGEALGRGRTASPHRSIQPCGTIQGVRDRSGLGAVQNLGITPSHRGRGLGTLLLSRSLEGFRSAGLRRAFLEVTAQNAGALRLYERLGFRKVKTVYKASDVAYA